MKYELLKISSNKYFRILFFVLILLNVMLFYTYCTDDSEGYSMKQIQTKYQDLQAVKQQQDKFENIMFQINDDNEQTVEGMLTGDIYSELALNRAVLDRVEQVDSYSEYRDNLVQDSYIKLKLGLLGSEDSFSARSLERGANAYSKLDNVTPKKSFFGGVELLANWHISDIFLICICLIISFVLITYEKNTGHSVLTITTKNGHCKYFIRKFSAGAFVITIAFLILNATNIITTFIFFGIPDFSAPIQSLYGYVGCPMHISVGQFYVELLFFKLLWCVALFAVSMLICSIFSSALFSTMMMLFVASISLIFGNSKFLWLKNISFSELMFIDSFFKGAVYLNFFEIPVSRLPIVILFLLLVIVGSVICGIVSFCKIPVGNKFKLKKLKNCRMLKTLSISKFEFYKAFVMCSGAFILVLFLCVQFFTYQNYKIINTEYEHYYRYYSSIFEGEPNTEKDNFIKNEKKRFEELNNQLLEYAEKKSESDIVVIPTNIQDELKAQEAFETACNQYEQLKKGQSYLYQSGYTKIFGPESRKEIVLNFAKLFSVISLLMCGLFSVEKETGVYILQKTAGKVKTVNRIKFGIIVFYVIASTLIAFLPWYIVVLKGYGGLIFSAQANSIMWLSHLSSIWSVLGVFLAMGLLYLGISSFAAAIVCFVSNKTENTVITLIVSLSILILATCISYVLIS